MLLTGSRQANGADNVIFVVDEDNYEYTYRIYIYIHKHHLHHMYD